MILPLVGLDDREITGKKLLINGLYGAVDVVDEKSAQMIKAGDPSGLSSSVYERLIARGHITQRSETEELDDALLIGHICDRIVNRAVIKPVIMPTYNCNFRCPYCFEKHRLSRDAEWLHKTISPKMIDAVFAALKERRERGYQIGELSLYGGEPFLKENRAAVQSICEHARALDLKLDAITNGYELDAYMDLLEEFRFKRLQITVDGVGALNDRRRLHRDGVPTYERIMSNISLALEHGVGITLRVNVDGENLGEIGTLLADLDRRGLKQTPDRFSCYFKAVTGAPGQVTDQMVMDKLLSLGIKPLDAIRHESRFGMHLTALEPLLSGEGSPAFTTAFCGAESGALVIGPDGRIYACWDVVAREQDSVGFTDVESGRFFFNYNKAKWRLRTSDHMEPCRTCPHILACRGGCAADAGRYHGDYFREFCGEERETFAFTASRVIGRKWEETQEEQLSESLFQPLSKLTESERRILTTGKPVEMAPVLEKIKIFDKR